jgi:hypothetical protein
MKSTYLAVTLTMLAFLYFVTPSSAQMLLDDFDGTASIKTSASAFSVTGPGGPSDALGDRTITAQLNPSSSFDFARTSFLLTPGSLTFEGGYLSPTSSTSLWSVVYGSGANPPLNLDLSAYNSFEVDYFFDSPEDPHTSQAKLWFNGVSAPQAQGSISRLSWQQSQFTGVDFTDIDSITISLSVTPNPTLDLDDSIFRMDRFRAVPEPGTLSLVGFGTVGLGLIACRRSRVRKG